MTSDSVCDSYCFRSFSATDDYLIGKPGARIETREFPTYPRENLYACQDWAWMDEHVMRNLVQMVLKPYIKQALPGFQPPTFLDQYCCHMMACVVNIIQDLGVQIETIPGGCTGLCQPINIWIGKPLKSRARHVWEEWAINEGVNVAVLRPPLRLQLSQWINDCTQRIHESTPSIVQNSWQHGAYSYFPNEGQERHLKSNSEKMYKMNKKPKARRRTTATWLLKKKSKRNL